TSRRAFLQASSAVVVGGAVSGGLQILQNAHAGGSGLIRVGLVGCRGRGTGAAAQALSAAKAAKLVAMGEPSEAQRQKGLATHKKDPQPAAKIDVPSNRRSAGFDAYKQVIDCCDLVLLCTPPHFRPLHLQAAVDARRHIFAEKPVAVDAPGVR